MDTHQVCSAPQHSAIHVMGLPGVVALVEDPSIQKLLGDLLTRRGYRVMRLDAARAIEMVESGHEVDLVITNTPERFLSCAEAVPLLYLAGAPDLDIASRFSQCRVLQKPFRTEHLLETVRDLTGSL